MRTPGTVKTCLGGSYGTGREQDRVVSETRIVELDQTSQQREGEMGGGSWGGVEEGKS